MKAPTVLLEPPLRDETSVTDDADAQRLFAELDQLPDERSLFHYERFATGEVDFCHA
ncbi:hypothetical protein DPMN_059211 [Dreissena polymorpha]|uniref:Uncharacterized protein n=1 Tax=Dreissena polymorpha TaxID=45954 RepID=A0A9D4C3P3_DREPO|nr:hypothetical protein DPMN_059211 [Dreissena polymorpha]